MRFVPHDYQEASIKFLLETANAGLFFRPGAGKTAIVLAVLRVLKDLGMMRRALIVAPQRVATQVWPDERMKWNDFLGLSMCVLHGPKKDQLLDRLDHDIAVVTPDGLDWLQSKRGGIQVIGADVLVVDESSYFRNHRTLRFKNLRGKLPLFKRRIILTGTPAPRGYGDLWAQVFLMDMGGALEPYVSHYRMKYFVNIGTQFDDWVVRSDCIPLINDRIRPFVLRDDNDNRVRLPALGFNTIRVQLPDTTMREYDRLASDFILQVRDAEVIAGNAAVLGGKLRQLASGFLYTGEDAQRRALPMHTEKFNALRALLDELQGQSAMIVYEFNYDRDRLRQMLPDAGHFTTGQSAAATKALIDGFNDGTLQHLLVHPASAGHGLNLQDRAAHVIWLGPTWNLEHYIQTNARVWRQGNTNARVTIHTIVAANTMDERVAQVLEHKDAVQGDLLRAMKTPLQTMVAA